MKKLSNVLVICVVFLILLSIFILGVYTTTPAYVVLDPDLNITVREIILPIIAFLDLSLDITVKEIILQIFISIFAITVIFISLLVIYEQKYNGVMSEDEYYEN